MTKAKPKVKFRVVIDGSNLATEGRTTPSLSQLLECAAAFQAEHPGAGILMVVDATLEHKLTPSERAKLKQMEIDGDVVAPPAGSIGRGDAFILKIAERIDAVVLSNDSFQEFQADHAWLFDEGRLVGGKPVKGVGWIFTPRIPVKGVKRLTTVTKKPATPTPKEAPEAPAAKSAKATKSLKALKPEVAKVAKKPVTPSEAPKKAPAKKAAPKKAPAKAPASKTAEKPVAVKRDRAPVNGEVVFSHFLSSTRLKANVDGVVAAFTSHGAVINLETEHGTIECYAPTTGLGTPAPARARDVLTRGERRRFKLVAVDRERRIAELALA